MMGLLNHQRVGQRGKYALEFNGTTGQGGTGQAFDILSYWRPSLGRSAGARLTVIRRAGSASPDATRAARTGSRGSDTALSGSPTTFHVGCECPQTVVSFQPGEPDEHPPKRPYEHRKRPAEGLQLPSVLYARPDGWRQFSAPMGLGSKLRGTPPGRARCGAQ